jgi:UDP-glucuronate 4-epimerase
MRCATPWGGAAKQRVRAEAMKVLITGAAGFIGSALTLRLLDRGDEVIGVDNLNEYYDPNLKRARLARHATHPGYTDVRASIADRQAMDALFAQYKPQRVVNLAAQAGVRYSLINPYAYIESNLVGFANILEGCRQHNIEHLVYASTSSVYGANTKLPFSIHDSASHPLTLYAASKRANELMAHSYSHLYRLATTGLRFFTVYGPWGRPDMALFTFTKAIIEDQPIQVFNFGKHRRSFTYIDDVVEGVVRVLDKIAEPDLQWQGDAPDPATSAAPYRLYNLGRNNSVELLRYVEVLEECLGKKAIIDLLPLQPGDVPETRADMTDLETAVGYEPATPIDVGVKRFVEWYRSYYAA